MKSIKLTSMVWAILTAAVLWITPVWAAEQDTGYPWFYDIVEENDQPISQPSSNYHLAPLLPPGQDTGYPWYADIKEDENTMKPFKVFGTHPKTAEGDTGYPWHADTEKDNQSRSTTQ